MNRNPSADVSAALNVGEAAQGIGSREDLVAFLTALRYDLQTKPEQWANRDLPTYLEALAAWASDLEGYYRNTGQAIPAQPSWKMFAEMLLAAKVYE